MVHFLLFKSFVEVYNYVILFSENSASTWVMILQGLSESILLFLSTSRYFFILFFNFKLINLF